MAIVLRENEINAEVLKKTSLLIKPFLNRTLKMHRFFGIINTEIIHSIPG